MIHKNWQELIRPTALDIRPGADPQRQATVIAEPLERGFGLTLGNALRRVLLSSLQGGAITSIQIDGVLHEFSSVAGVREDVTDIVLNIKGVAVKKQWGGPGGEDPRGNPGGGGKPLMACRLSLLVVMALMPLVGHLGGNMTHKPNYLTQRTPSDLLVSAGSPSTMPLCVLGMALRFPRNAWSPWRLPSSTATNLEKWAICPPRAFQRTSMPMSLALIVERLMRR